MRQIYWLLSSSVVLIGAACAGSSDQLEEGVGKEAESLCVAAFERQRECTETFLPALIDLRVTLDKPSGIASAQQKLGKEALLKSALEEWRADSTDAAISKTCASLASETMSTPARISKARTCLSASSCAEFVPCQIELVKAHLSE